MQSATSITLAAGLNTNPPIGAPVQLLVTGVTGSAINAVTVVPQIPNSSPSAGGSYFVKQTNPVAMGSSTGSGTGATFNLTYGAQGSQRVILCNQEFATLVYITDIVDPNIMDELFIHAFSRVPQLSSRWSSSRKTPLRSRTA